MLNNGKKIQNDWLTNWLFLGVSLLVGSVSPIQQRRFEISKCKNFNFNFKILAKFTITLNFVNIILSKIVKITQVDIVSLVLLYNNNQM